MPQVFDCVCVWKALNQRVSAGGHPCHHWWMANKEANDESCKRTCEFLTSDMARWLSHKPPMPTWHDNITWHDFISSHFILPLRGVSKCVFDRNLMLVTCFYRFLFISQVSPYGMQNQSWEYPVYTHISDCGEWWDETYFHMYTSINYGIPTLIYSSMGINPRIIFFHIGMGFPSERPLQRAALPSKSRTASDRWWHELSVMYRGHIVNHSNM